MRAARHACRARPRRPSRTASNEARMTASRDGRIGLARPGRARGCRTAAARPARKRIWRAASRARSRKSSKCAGWPIDCRAPAPRCAASSVTGSTKAGSMSVSSTCGALRHRVGEARRRAEKVGEEQAQAVVRLQDGEQLDGRRHAAEGAVEGRERGVGIGGAAERRKQGRHELGQDLAGARARDGRRGGRNASRARSRPPAPGCGSRGAAASRACPGSSVVPVKTRLPTSEVSSGPSSNSSA